MQDPIQDPIQDPVGLYKLAAALCAGKTVSGKGEERDLDIGLRLFRLLLGDSLYKQDAFLKLMELTTDPEKIRLLVSEHCPPQQGVYHDFIKYRNPAVYHQADILCKIMADKGGVSYQLSVAGKSQKEKKWEEAAHYVGLAADQGNSRAQHELGKMFAEGWGVPKNEEKAVVLYRLAVEKGNDDAHLSLAIMLLDGRGVERNRAEAFRLLRLVAPRNRQANYLIEVLEE